jgi:glycosyltransferase involved in cell wall biosynthesis
VNKLNEKFEILISSRCAIKYPRIGGAARYSMLIPYHLSNAYPEKYIVHFVGQYKPDLNKDTLIFHKIESSFQIDDKNKVRYFMNAFLVDLKIAIKSFFILNKNKKIKIAHVNSNISVIILKILKNKLHIIYTLHDPIYEWEKTENILEKIVRIINNRFLESLAIKLSDRIIAVSPELKMQIERIYKKDSILILPYPSTLLIKNMNIDEKNFLEKLGVVKKSYILSIGQQNKRKRFDIIIESLSSLQQKNIKLILVGNGSENENLKNLVKQLNLEDRVIFLSQVSNEELQILYKNALFYILASEREGFPATVFESLSLGTPSLLFLKDVKNTLILNSKYLRIFNSLEKEKIINEINNIINDLKNNLEYNSEKIIKWTFENFNFNKYGNLFNNIYESLIEH